MHPFRGINHLALVTNDMDKTVRFYRDILGMPLIAALGNYNGPQSFRHYFFELGAGNTIAFFEWGGAEITQAHKPAGVPANGWVQFDHVSFNVDDEDALLALQSRLRERGVHVTRVVDHDFIHSIYFTDPNGIALEASYWLVDPTGQPPAYENQHVFHDPRPVPALQEAMDAAREPVRAL